MSASVNRPAGTFAQQLSAHARAHVTSAGGDLSGRWLAARTDRGKGYWASILTGDVAMNTNDIALLAELFQTSPYEFVRAARYGDSPSEDTRAPRQSFALAASDDHEWQETQEQGEESE